MTTMFTLPDNVILQALLATTFTWLLTALGAASVFFTSSHVSRLGANLMLGFAAGVMLAASYWSLLAPALALSEHMGKFSWLPAATGLMPTARKPLCAARCSKAQVMKVLPISVSVPVRK